jgi:hypothetical protein
MKILVTDDYRIISDAYCWMVQQRIVTKERSKNPGEVYWLSVSWHPTVIQAGRSLSDRLWRLVEPGEGESITSALERLDEVVRMALKRSEMWADIEKKLETV